MQMLRKFGVAAAAMFFPLTVALPSFVPAAAHAQSVIWSKAVYGRDAFPGDVFCPMPGPQQSHYDKTQVVDAAGNVFVTGCAANDGLDFITYKLNGATGAVVWSAAYHSNAGLSAAAAIALDASGNVAVTGTSPDAVGGLNFRTIKYDGATGAELWNVAYDGAVHGSDAGTAITADAAGNVLVTGASEEAGGATSIRTIKYDGSTGALLWTAAFSGGANGNDQGQAIVTDASGNVYVAGMSSAVAGYMQFRVIKYDGVTGNQVWTNVRVPSGQAYVTGLALDPFGKLVIVGWDSAGVMVTIKYDGATGSEQWNQAWTGGLGFAVATDAAGDVLATGTSSDVDGSHMLTVKYDASGTEVWHALSPATSYSAGYAIAIDSNGDAVVTGISTDAISGNDIRVVKYDGAVGGQVWSTRFDGSASGNDQGNAIGVDAAGNVFITGTTREAAWDADGIRTLKLDGANGAIVWNKLNDRMPTPVNVSLFTKAIAADAAGNAYITGSSVDFLANRVRTVKLDGVTGEETWSSAFAAAGGNDGAGYAVAADAAGHVAVTGYVLDTDGYHIATIDYDAATGAPIWSALFPAGAAFGEAGLSVAFDASGNVLVAGRRYTASSVTEMRTIKYDGVTGSQLWTASYRGSGSGLDQAVAVAVTSGNDVVITGVSNDGAQGANIRTIKYDGATGAEIWNVAYDDVAHDDDVGVALAVDAFDNIVVAGASGGGQMRTIKYDGASGTQLWTAALDGGFAHAVGLDGLGNVLVAGYGAAKYDGANGSQLWSAYSSGGAGSIDDVVGVAIDSRGDVVVNASTNDPTMGEHIRAIKYNGKTGAQLWSLTHAAASQKNDRASAIAIGNGNAVYSLGESIESSGSQAFFVQKIANLPPSDVAATDFNADSHPDIVWSNTANGSTFVWFMSGTPPVLLSDQFIAQIDPSWKVQGIADFNGDGQPDLVWRNTATGNCYVWYLNNGIFNGVDAFLFGLPPQWVIQGIADFNGDGKPDFLMRNTDPASGVGFAWYFDNNVAIGSDFLFGIDPSWKVEQVGDLDGDGQPDLLFRSMTSGLAFAWYTQFSGGHLSLAGSSPPIFSIDPAWEIVQLQDWDGDGQRDLLFRNSTTGVVFVWYLNGTVLTPNSDFVVQIDPSWEIVPRR